MNKKEIYRAIEQATFQVSHKRECSTVETKHLRILLFLSRREIKKYSTKDLFAQIEEVKIENEYLKRFIYDKYPSEKLGIEIDLDFKKRRHNRLRRQRK